MFCDKKSYLLILLFQPVNILFACTLDVSSGVNFGSYNPFSSGTNVSMTQLEVTCPEGGSSAFTLTLDTGSSGEFSDRTMISGDFTMNYNIYIDPAYTTVWGDGTSGTGLVSDEGSDCVTGCQYTAYGLIPPNQTSVGVGSYADTVNVTLSF